MAAAGPVNWSTANESRSALDHPGRRLTSMLIDDCDDLDRLSVVTSSWKSNAYTPIRVHPRLQSVVRWSCRGHCAGGAAALEALVRAKGIVFSRD